MVCNIPVMSSRKTLAVVKYSLANGGETSCLIASEPWPLVRPFAEKINLTESIHVVFTVSAIPKMGWHLRYRLAWIWRVDWTIPMSDLEGAR
jgi:hypothetical protein